MMMLIDCSGCRTPLQLPHGAPCIRCAICGAITHVAPAAPADPNRGAVQPAPGWGPPPPPVHGRKRAVVCGISYRYSRHELKGCINDAKCMRHLLMTRFNFPDDSIIMLNGGGGAPGFGHVLELMKSAHGQRRAVQSSGSRRRS